MITQSMKFRRTTFAPNLAVCPVRGSRALPQPRSAWKCRIAIPALGCWATLRAGPPIFPKGCNATATTHFASWASKIHIREKNRCIRSPACRPRVGERRRRRRAPGADASGPIGREVSLLRGRDRAPPSRPTPLGCSSPSTSAQATEARTAPVLVPVPVPSSENAAKLSQMHLKVLSSHRPHLLPARPFRPPVPPARPSPSPCVLASAGQLADD